MKRNFEIVKEGTSYLLPVYEVQDEVGIVLTDKTQEINFVRGDKTPNLYEIILDKVEKLNNLAAFIGENFYEYEVSSNSLIIKGNTFNRVVTLGQTDLTQDYSKLLNEIQGLIIRANRQEGTLHEHLLSMMIHDLKYKNKLVPSRETSIAITHLEEARMWMEERQRNREADKVQGTYDLPKLEKEIKLEEISYDSKFVFRGE